MSEYLFPRTQSELIRAARGGLTQAAFARLLKVDRTCLSRYESEKLGAPTKVINFCLERVAEMGDASLPSSDIERALALTKGAMQSLERATKATR